jgi:predicted ATPase
MSDYVLNFDSVCEITDAGTTRTSNLSEAVPTMITRLEVKNYRSLGNIRISLEPLTVLAGPNGAGKSNVIDSLRFVRDALTVGLKEAVLIRGGRHRISHRTSSETPDVVIRLCFSGTRGSGEYAFVLETENLRVRAEKLSLTPAGSRDTAGFEIRDGKPVPEKNGKTGVFRLGSGFKVSEASLSLPGLKNIFPEFDAVYQFLSNMKFYNIPPENLRAPQPESEGCPLDEQGRNLNSVLKSLKEKHPSESRNLLSAMKAAVPKLEDYSVTSAGVYLITCLHYGYSLKKPVFELAQESDGTLRMLAVLTALCQPPVPLMTLEEPELNIHPAASGILGDILQEAVLNRQIIITTHSPDLADMFSPNLLRIVEKEDGITRAGLLSKSQCEAVAENLFTPGELMRIHGLQRKNGD